MVRGKSRREDCDVITSGKAEEYVVRTPDGGESLVVSVGGWDCLPMADCVVVYR